jgi:hypothetical protein
VNKKTLTKKTSAKKAIAAKTPAKQAVKGLAKAVSLAPAPKSETKP